MGVHLLGDLQNAATRGLKPTSVAKVCLTANLLLAAAKLIVGSLTHSVAILSDGINSACDLVATGITYMAILHALRPPDPDHPWGHGKYESLAGIVEAGVITSAGIFVVWDALKDLMHPVATDTGSIGLAVMVVSALVNGGLSHWVIVAAGRLDSIALRAEGQHIRTDVITSIGVLASLLASHYLHIPHIQAAAALMISVFIFRASYRVAVIAVAPLVDRALPEDEILQIHQLLKSEPGVLGYHNLRTRRSGAIRHIDLHVMMHDELSFSEAHHCAEVLEKKLQQSLPGTVDVIVHAEPFMEEIRHQEQHHVSEE